jgi:hypothetical protein
VGGDDEADVVVRSLALPDMRATDEGLDTGESSIVSYLLGGDGRGAPRLPTGSATFVRRLLKRRNGDQANFMEAQRGRLQPAVPKLAASTTLLGRR